MKIPLTSGSKENNEKVTRTPQEIAPLWVLVPLLFRTYSSLFISWAVREFTTNLKRLQAACTLYKSNDCNAVAWHKTLGSRTRAFDE